MDAKGLEVLGFSSWASFTLLDERKLLRGLPRKPGVYAVLFPSPERRAIGASDITYIGKATNQDGLRGRVRQYYHPGPTQSTNMAMHQRICERDCALRLGFIVCATGGSARRLESDLLLQFTKEHGERPPYNKQNALDLIARLTSGEAV